MILNDDECRTVYNDAMELPGRSAVSVTRAVEAAVIRKLAAGVSVEPVDGALLDDMVEGSHPSYGRGLFTTDNCIKPLYTATAIAAARVQALEEARDIVLNFQAGWIPDGFTECADAIRALLGKEAT